MQDRGGDNSPSFDPVDEDESGARARFSGVLAILLLALDIRQGAAGIITRRDQRHSPAAKLTLAALRKAAVDQGAETVSAKQRRR